jgi:hypothetical protein
LGFDPIPAANNKAYLNQDKYSTRVFNAKITDESVVIYGRDNQSGPWVSDEVRHRNVLISHFPTNTVPASGTDGHCEIVDPASGLLHSFFRLIFDTKTRVWQATKYTAAALDDSGWGTPSAPDGPRAAGVSTAGGLLRIHEVGLETLSHVLAIGTHANVFRSGPQFPATLQDRNGPASYSGDFPMGTLFMLPGEFHVESLTWPNARTIAHTLKSFGARLVDQTVGTFAFYGEIGGGWSQAAEQGRWQSSWERDLVRIRDGLRAVTSVSGWLDANGERFTPTPWEKMNLLSMRGPWVLHGGIELSGSGFETTEKMFLFPESTAPVAYRKTIYWRDDHSQEPWFQWMDGRWYTNPQPGATYRLRAKGFGDANGSLAIRPKERSKHTVLVDALYPGQASIFRSPPDEWSETEILVWKQAGPPAGIRLELELL